MKKTVLSLVAFLSISISFSQIVTMSPTRAFLDDQITITYDATQGNSGLVGASKVYAHMGVVTVDTENPVGSDWSFVVGNWGQDDGVGEMTQVAGEPNKWELTLSPSIKDYFDVPSGIDVFWISMVFRSADGNLKGTGTPGTFQGGKSIDNGDIFLKLGDFVQILQPNATIVKFDAGGSVIVEGYSSVVANTVSVFIDEGAGFGAPRATANNANTVTYDYMPSGSGNFTVKVEADITTEVLTAESDYALFENGSVPIASRPAGIQDGINYHDGDDSKVTLSLLAPNKDFAYVVGDFNNWSVDNNYLMNQTPDGERFWLEITGLSPGQEYVFQYWVDGIIKIGDPLADKVADPWNDSSIPPEIYPNLPAYDRTDNAIATVLQTAQTPYAWAASEDTWERPPKEELVIYELLVRDFVGSHYYKDLIDSLDYLEKLGVNAIELLPIMEFEGNESWGYNPMYFLAPDKYYGTKNDLKEFIEIAHQRGFAVILDMVLNHAFGLNAMVRMYPGQTGSPWFNAVATHPFNVGTDFNHETQYTKDFVDTVNLYWLEEYHFDGFRFDLSKGFTQNVGKDPEDVGAWGQYDQSRVDILTRMANTIWNYDPDTYVILEHLSEENEEVVLRDAGMITWANANGTFRSLTAGQNTSASISWINDDRRVVYMESHDEERLQWANKNNGIIEGNYNIRELQTGTDRVKMASAFFYTQPGPKMMWMFQELGYDLAINTCRDGVTIEPGCRVDNKPLPWGSGNLGYYEDPIRFKLIQAHGAIINLTRDYREVFKEGSFSFSQNGSTKRINIAHATMDVTIIGNFDTEMATIDPNFSVDGTWYDFFSDDQIEVTDVNEEIGLFPGEFHIYTTLELPSPGDDLVGFPDPPRISEIANQSTNENEVLGPVAFTIDPRGKDFNDITLSAVSSNSNVVFTSDVVLEGTDENRTFTITPRAGRSGTTTITITASDGTYATEEMFELEVIDVVTGLEDNNFTRRINIYPNPSDDLFQVGVGDGINGELTLTVIDFTGRIHLVKEAGINRQNSDISLDASGLRPGVYFLQIEEKDKNTGVFRLLVE